ncbi:serine hydroxymethyltransferase [Spiroplasma endosymbiont of Labia minor]|uniref:serine hydroxymethyltransferase n=1 Tax=Spiroplasma endosymbiont of Labia minor TaxID=3066305 RepID=UPI0030CFEC65
MDKRLSEILNLELKRQQENIELIASENFVSKAVMDAMGSVATNKYAEGYPNKRYYGGCEYIDQMEQLAIDTVKKLFNVEYANVQPHSGSQANAAVYFALAEHNDKVVAMSLDAGGHLTHGSVVNFSGKSYHFYHYGVDKETEMIDYDAVEKLVMDVKPKILIAGASAYSRIIDFKRFREIADKVNAYLFVDMAHIAGLVISGDHPNPCEYAHVVTSTTHKTLRGARGGIILTNDFELNKKFNSAIFPGTQGGPLENMIAGKAQCFLEASTKEFKTYGNNVVINAKTFAKTLSNGGCRIITGGTDNHLINIDVKTNFNITGKEADAILHKINITTNKNMIPFDTEKPIYTSGLRVGTPAMTTRGFVQEDFEKTAEIMCSAFKDPSEQNLVKLKQEVLELVKKYPMYEDIKY